MLLDAPRSIPSLQRVPRSLLFERATRPHGSVPDPLLERQ
jgi:hypothetical protein